MNKITLFVLISLSFHIFMQAQIVEQYSDETIEGLTVIEKIPESDNQVILKTLDINEYNVGDVVFITDHRTLAEIDSEEKEQQIQQHNTAESPRVLATNLEEKTLPSPSILQEKQNIEVVQTNPSPSISVERNPIGEKVKQKHRRTPKWKSDRRKKQSIAQCFRF